LAKKAGFIWPSVPSEWKKIDPITEFYYPEWISWMTPELDRSFKYIQELSRLA